MPVKKHVDPDFSNDPNEVAHAKRVDLAYNYYLYLDLGDRKSYRKCAAQYGIAWETL
jgi:cytochrome c oxidase assembly protein Cox11